MFQLSLFTEFGGLCNPFDYILGFTCLLMLAHFLFLLFNLRERRRVKLFCLGGATLVLLLHIAAVVLAWQFSMAFEVGTAPGALGRWGPPPGSFCRCCTCSCHPWCASHPSPLSNRKSLSLLSGQCKRRTSR